MYFSKDLPYSHKNIEIEVWSQQCVLSKIGGCYSNSGKTAVFLAFSGVVIKHCSLGGMFVRITVPRYNPSSRGFQDSKNLTPTVTFHSWEYRKKICVLWTLSLPFPFIEFKIPSPGDSATRSEQAFPPLFKIIHRRHTHKSLQNIWLFLICETWIQHPFSTHTHIHTHTNSCFSHVSRKETS